MTNAHMLATENCKGLTKDELDILTEVVNISFGKASADLADVVDVFVIMSIPQVRVLKESELRDYLIGEVAATGSSSVVEQHFWGRFKGAALIFFNPEAGVALTYLFNGASDSADADDEMEKARESVMTAGGILAVACISKIAECLDDMVTYTPPSYSDVDRDEAAKDAGLPAARDRDTVAITTPFSFDKDGFNGFLTLVADPDSLQWIKDSLNRFMERYG